MTYFGRYKHPDGRWMKWLKFPGQDDARTHCNRMARGQKVELLSEQEYNLKYNQVPAPKETDSTGAYQRLVEGLGRSEDMEYLEEDSSWELEEKRKVGRPKIDRPSKKILQHLYISEKKSIRVIAAELGLTRDLIHSSLKEHGIETRSTFKPSKLARYPLEMIREKVRALGYQRAADSFGVALSTLYFYEKTH